jgi:hypothetical protein
MAAHVLLVTWFAYGQPPSSYQAAFDSERACGLARFAVLAEAERMATEVKVAVENAAKRGAFLPASASPPKVSAICTPKGN